MITTTIKSIQDIMRQDTGVDGDAQRLSQLGWMLFLKILDDREVEYELERPDYRSPIPEQLRWRNWAADPEGITGEELTQFVTNELFPTLKELPADASLDPLGVIVRRVFEDAYHYMKSGTLFRQVINKINEIDFTASEDRHLFNDIYEKILKDLQSAGNAGEYYTPRAVTQFVVDMVGPKLGEKLLDPACGTGGFLVNALEHIGDSGALRTAEDYETLQRQIHGVEKKPLPHLLCTTNMLLHGLEVPVNIRRDNTLARPYRDYGPKDQVDVVITNPPFGGTEEPGIEDNFPADFRTRETADLFLVLIMRLLKPGGRCGIVLPDGTLFGEGVKTRIKTELLETCDLHSIVRLPNGVFNPYTGIRTNLLFFEKGRPTKGVWYYEHPYPQGYKSYSKTKPMRIEEFEPEKAWWENRQESEQAWYVPIEEIRERNYNLDIKNPHSPEAEQRDPEELYREYKEATEETRRIASELRDKLAEYLSGASR
ncbi:MAG: N-6 DNA methylase [Alkalispirochaetaceae bacterium]